ncbi:CDGSH iron-sulfur domain-containing protein [Eubacteriales bacterium OttesenSCG-928-N13]|nr:CDGSH iron-sulfur domain-containing protein [Eubacteriales bacterium OttesenSCG-928-N13]
MAKYRIRILKSGPYEVSENTPLRIRTIVPDKRGAGEKWAEGREYPATTEPYHLCRCGHSKNKPFCDGSHAKMHFDGAEVADKAPYDQTAKVYEGAKVDLMDREEWCAVARFCDVGAGVWQMAVESDKPNYEEMATYQACNCPSGRLTIRKKDGTKVEPELPPEVNLVQDPARGVRGPLWITGGVELIGADGESYEIRNRMTLCRCGESSNMPYCDASHLNCSHMRGADE